MTLPQKLTDLLEDLRDELDDPQLTHAGNNARLRVTIKEGTFDLTKADLPYLLSSTDAAQRFYLALGRPPDCALTLIDVSVEDEVLEMLEHLFSSVEEE